MSLHGLTIEGRILFNFMPRAERLDPEEYRQTKEIHEKRSLPSTLEDVLTELRQANRLDAARWSALREELLELRAEARRRQLREERRAKGLDVFGLPLLSPNIPRVPKAYDNTRRVRRPRPTK